MLSLNSFSQVDTTKTSLPNKILREVAKDLVRYDGCKEELKQTQLKVIRLTEVNTQKDTIINLLKDKDENNKFIIHQMSLQMNQYEKLSYDLQKDLKKQKAKSFFWKVGTLVGILTTSYLLIR